LVPWVISSEAKQSKLVWIVSSLTLPAKTKLALSAITAKPLREAEKINALHLQHEVNSWLGRLREVLDCAHWLARTTWRRHATT
jgi:hypothetical protein